MSDTSEDDVDDGKDSMCSICGQAGTLVACDVCPKAYHADCLPFEIDMDADFDCTMGEQHCEQRQNKTFHTRTVNAVLSLPLRRQQGGVKHFQCVNIDGVEYRVGEYVYVRREAGYVHDVPWVAELTALYRQSQTVNEKWCTLEYVYMPEDTSVGRLRKHHAQEVFLTHKSLDYLVGEITGKCLVVHESEYEASKKLEYWKDHLKDVFFYKMLYNDDLGVFRPAPLPSEKNKKPVFSPSSSSSSSSSTNTPMSNAKRKKNSKEEDKEREKDDKTLMSIATQKPNKRRKDAVSQSSITTVAEEEEDEEEEKGGLLERAAARLQLSAVPESLPCREKEHAVVMEYLESTIARRGKSNGMYISGMPGTGKTATVRQVVRELKLKANHGDIPDFDFFEINALRLATPQQAYTVLLQELEGQTLVPQKALGMLDRRFDRADPKRRCCVVLLDEIDYIQNRNHSVLYNFFEWPSRRHARLCVVGIANTMNLPESLPLKVQSRLGLQRVTFLAYTRLQLESIVKARLTNVECFQKKAIEMCARKVSSISGDVRRCLQASRRAIEICQLETVKRKAAGEEEVESCVTLDHIIKATQEQAGEPIRQLLLPSSLYEKAFLVSLLRLCADEQTDNTERVKPMSRIITRCQSFLPKMKIPTLIGPNFVEYQDICARLEESGILTTDRTKINGDWEVTLKIEPDEIALTFQDDPQVSSLLKI